MKRKYTSRRRAESAENTRLAIVEAAIRMHSQGITTLSAVAEEAGVSLPTVNKYFPTREDLFTACTTHFASMVELPAPETLAAIPDDKQRIEAVVAEVFRLHEVSLGPIWTGFKLEDESPVLANAIAEQEQYVADMVDVLPLEADSTLRPFVTALLNPLTYRALRVRNGLDYEAAVEHTAQVLTGLLIK
jgi:AcrR family transcriptional regulator